MLNKINVYDEHNQPTGRTSTINHAMRYGWWHRGAHVVVCTKTGYILVQKRSSSMITHPGYLDFSAAGYVDSGESPEQAAIREVQEEVGLNISEKDLHFIRILKKNHFWPKLHKKSRVFAYVYVVCLPDHNVSLSLQQTEVEWARFVPVGRVRRLVRLHRLKALGRIEPTYAFYADMLLDTQKFMQT